MTDAWEDLADWWLAERAGDGAYETEVGPLVLELLRPEPDLRYLDLGCGDGTTMFLVRQVGARVLGVDLNRQLLARAVSIAPCVCARLPDLGWLAGGSVDGAYASLVVEHIRDLDVLFVETAGVVRPGGKFVVVSNHPAHTAPGSGPIVDPTDGEVFWRWGSYLVDGCSEEPAGDLKLSFYHRSFSSLLNRAALAGWCFEHAIERGVGILADSDALLAEQRDFPRLLGVRWRLEPRSQPRR